jgi:uncharacterized small protein (DUF1192 family)
LGYAIFDDTGAIEFVKQQADAERKLALDGAQKQYESHITRLNQQLTNEAQSRRVLAGELERLQRGMAELVDTNLAAGRIATLEEEVKRREAELTLKDREIRRLQGELSGKRNGRTPARSSK